MGGTALSRTNDTAPENYIVFENWVELARFEHRLPALLFREFRKVSHPYFQVRVFHEQDRFLRLIEGANSPLCLETKTQECFNDCKEVDTKMKCLSIQLVGHEFVRAFPNKEKTLDKHPDYKGDGVAVWIREFKEKDARSQDKA